MVKYLKLLLETGDQRRMPLSPLLFNVTLHVPANSVREGKENLKFKDKKGRKTTVISREHYWKVEI